ncbi:MAG TPA: hypothetical protein VH092_19675 [Urbifossiella sp.]|jgi:hypothetical protein|nr:hypothetical protein [Urbifossiella sp.]
MRRFLWAGVTAGFGLAAVLAAGSAGAADEKAPDWTGYTTVATEVVGTVVKADDNAVTLRVKWYVPQGNGNRRPSLSGYNRSGRRPSGSQVKEVHHDYVLEYVPQSLVRHKAMPVKLDDKGKRIPWTDKESHDLRQPAGVPGYVGTKAEVTAGMVVDVIVIRDRKISAEKATEDDLRLKYVYILGSASTSPGAGPSLSTDKKSASKGNN